MKGLMMGEKRLLNGMRHGVLSALSFTESDGVRYFDQKKGFEGRKKLC